MIVDQLKSDLITAQKERDETTVSILRFLLAQITNARIAKSADLTDDEVQDQIAKEVKRHRESIAAFESGGRAELAQKESAELVILQKYLPEQMSDTELAGLVAATIQEVGASTVQDMGKVIGSVMAKVKGKAEGATVSRLVKEKLS